MKILSFLTSLLVLANCGTQQKTSKTESSIKVSEIDYTGNYKIIDEKFGTNTTVTIADGNRIIKTNALPNHEVGTFPNPKNPNTISTQNSIYKITTTPKTTGTSKWARQPGVAVNGIKFEPQTAERFICETGEVYSVEAFQDLLDMGLDSNNAHVQPTGAYHYHGVPTNLIKKLDKGEDIILVGYAMDGFPMYYSKSGKYKPSFKLSEESRTGELCSYKRPGKEIDKELKETSPDGTFVSDWKFEESLGDLDECNGITINGNYSYFITDNYPRIGRCLKGEFSERGPKGPPPGGRNSKKGVHHHKPGEDHNH